MSEQQLLNFTADFSVDEFFNVLLTRFANMFGNNNLVGWKRRKCEFYKSKLMKLKKLKKWRFCVVGPHCHLALGGRLGVKFESVLSH